MRIKRTGFEFRVKLGAKIKRMFTLRQFGNLHQIAVRVSTGENKPGLFQFSSAK